MSEKCNCVNSRLFPHRVNKCMLASKSKKETAPAPSTPPPPPRVIPQIAESDGGSNNLPPPLPLDVVENNGQPPVESVASDTELIEAEEVEISNALIANGNEQCDCIAYRLQNHRKNKCRWKKHLLIGVAAAVTVAGVVTAAVVLSEGSESTSITNPDPTSELGDSVEQLSLNEEAISAAQQKEEEDRRVQAAEAQQVTEREEQERAQAERAQEAQREVEREAAREAERVAEREAHRLQAEQDARIAAEEAHRQRAEQDRLLRQRIAYQNEQLRLQELENARLRREAEAAAQSARIYQQQVQVNQNMYAQNNVNYQQTHSYHTPVRVASRPTYGTTQSGTTCKNCIKVGGRCHQHR